MFIIVCIILLNVFLFAWLRAKTYTFTLLFSFLFGVVAWFFIEYLRRFMLPPTDEKPQIIAVLMFLYFCIVGCLDIRQKKKHQAKSESRERDYDEKG